MRTVDLEDIERQGILQSGLFGVEQILWFEIFSKAGFGLLLLIVPLTSLRVLGLDRPSTGMWPRFVGGWLVGIAASVFLALRFPDVKGGLGNGGLIAINFSAAAALLIPLIMGHAAPTRRGKFLVVLLVIILLTLAFFEIGYI